MEEFIEELKYNQNINIEKDLENRIDIDYVIERLEDINKQKVYIVLEENYNLLASDNGASYIYGCYDTKEKAINKAIEMINISLEDEWVLDDNDKEYNENPKEFLEKEKCVTTFWKYQENWQYYSEISIQELEVK